jgi:hypothetical protein
LTDLIPTVSEDLRAPKKKKKKVKKNGIPLSIKIESSNLPPKAPSPLFRNYNKNNKMSSLTIA